MLALGVFLSAKTFSCTDWSAPWKKKESLNGYVMGPTSVGSSVIAGGGGGAADDVAAERSSAGSRNMAAAVESAKLSLRS